MRQNIQDKILEVFYEDPSKAFTVRDIARSIKLPRATVHTYLAFLKKQGLVDKENKAQTDKIFRIKKINYYTEKIIISGLIDYLIQQLNPSAIILFGSIRKGESTQESDIDLFVEATAKSGLNLEIYERKLGHKVHLFVESSITKLPAPLLNNVINGIKLYGSFTIK